jgi:hypothetical protein
MPQAAPAKPPVRRRLLRVPPDANIQFLTVMATKMPFVGRG